jgi:hypothetical protein
METRPKRLDELHNKFNAEIQCERLSVIALLSADLSATRNVPRDRALKMMQK